MSELRATPGPWEVGVSSHNDLPCVDATDPKDGNLFELCEVWGEDREHEETAMSRANAQLIAAAPEMYAELNGRSLNTLLGMVEDSGDAEMWAAAQGFMDRRDELLRKARGGS